jgi:hypothetical protein
MELEIFKKLFTGILRISKMAFTYSGGNGCSSMQYQILQPVRTYEVVSESSQTVIVVTALEKEGERGGGLGHIAERLLLQFAM